MAYVCEVSGGQRLYLDCSGTDTIVTLASSSPGQQQQSSSRFATGAWTAPPQVFQAATRIAIKITTATGDRFLHLQNGSLSITTEALTDASAAQPQSLPLQPITQESGENAASLPPMQPMQMGNMQMSLNPMEMRMGDMTLRMGEPIASPNSTASQRRFCSQCGTAVSQGDRFCAHCGQALS